MDPYLPNYFVQGAITQLSIAGIESSRIGSYDIHFMSLFDQGLGQVKIKMCGATDLRYEIGYDN